MEEGTSAPFEQQLDDLTDWSFDSRVSATSQHLSSRVQVHDLGSSVELGDFESAATALRPFLSSTEHLSQASEAQAIGGHLIVVEPIGVNGRLDDEVTKGPIHWDDALWMGESLADIVATIHRAGHVHGELTIGLVNLDESMSPTVAGLEVAISRRLAARRGSAPPAIINPKRDVVSIGHILHGIITGGELDGLPGTGTSHPRYEDVPTVVATLIKSTCDGEVQSAEQFALLVQEARQNLSLKPPSNAAPSPRRDHRRKRGPNERGVFSAPEPIAVAVDG